MSYLERRRAWRRARAQYREMCKDGHAPVLQVTLVLARDKDDDWSHAAGNNLLVTGFKVAIPLTPQGEQWIRRAVVDIRNACVRLLMNEATGDERRPR